MFQTVRNKFQTVATIGIAAALAVGGVAVAQGNSQNGQGPGGPPAGNQGPGSEGQGNNRGRPAGPPPLPLPTQGLTNAQLHVQRNGHEQTIRVDVGKVVSASESSLTLSENDGSEVTIQVDEDTRVLGKPGNELTVEDLLTGQLVLVCGPEGGSAKTIMALPKKGQQNVPSPAGE